MGEVMQNYALGEWMPGSGQERQLLDAVNGELICKAYSGGVDFEAMMHFARNKGNPALRKMTFQERGLMLKALALHLHSKKESFYQLSYKTGATRADSWIDIEGGIGNLFAYASLRRKFPDKPHYVEDEPIGLSKGGSFMGHHILVPKEGVAVHINAYNFPVWGMLEKIAVNLLAGMPAIVKPAPVTAYLSEAVVREIVAANILPQGALQLVTGTGEGILEHLTSQDVVTFTGSASTGRKLKAHPRLIQESVPFTMEADSLNCAVLGEDALPGSPEFELFIKEIRKEMTSKAGQKCTAIRRALVPEKLLEDVQIALGQALAKISMGDPRAEGVRMGALVSREELNKLRERVKALARQSPIIYGDPERTPMELIGNADPQKGAFMAPILMLNQDPFHCTDTHEVEAFGPVATLMPYKNLEEAIALSKMGKGSLVSSIVTADPTIAREYTLGAATHHGRILVLDSECAGESTGHGAPMPMLIHGGPGRAGGGEEMGGIRGVKHFMQRLAIQGSPSMITAITGVYQKGAKQTEYDVHPFRRHFEELEIGETYISHKHTVTEADIANFANVSGDNFYAHVDATSLEGTMFEGRVAHGYYILSKAAGMFVHPKKGPVLLNYGLEECRFTKPVYPGMTIGVKLTAKEKIAQEKRNDDDIAKGIVKWLVDVSDETGETVAIATILTMVKKLKQD